MSGSTATAGTTPLINNNDDQYNNMFDPFADPFSENDNNNVDTYDTEKSDSERSVNITDTEGPKNPTINHVLTNITNTLSQRIQSSSSSTSLFDKLMKNHH